MILIYEFRYITLLLNSLLSIGTFQLAILLCGGIALALGILRVGCVYFEIYLNLIINYLYFMTLYVHAHDHHETDRMNKFMNT